MERLQNHILFRGNLLQSSKYAKYIKQHQLQFVYSANEQFSKYSTNTYLQTLNKYFPNSTTRIPFIEAKDIYVIEVPFTNMITNEIEMLPLSLIRRMVGTTGMCAGNSKAEAIVQGINEICERYILHTIFCRRCDFPTINLYDFIGTPIYSTIKSLSKYYNISVKDCSLGGKFPVVGISIIDNNKNSFTFKLGADYSLYTAIERCLSELFQGRECLDPLLKPIDFSYTPSIQDYYDCLNNGDGIYPSWLIIASTNKSQFPYKSYGSYETELNDYCRMLNSIGYDVFVRDCSYLEYPSYHIYIPGLSDLRYPLFDIAEQINYLGLFDNGIEPFLNVNNFSTLQAKSYLSIAGFSKILKINAWNTSENNIMYNNYFEFLLAASIQDYTMASSKLKQFISCIENSGLKCAKLIRESAKEIFNYLSNPPQLNGKDDILLSLGINAYPACPNCDACQVKHQCYYNIFIDFQNHLCDINKRYYYEHQ